MKKAVVAIILIAVLCFTRLACSAKETELSFTNKRGTVAHSVYISHESESEWGEPINSAKISNGSTIRFDFKDVSANGPGVYDVAVVDENNMNYDVYEVTLAIGDNITFSVSGETAIVTITSSSGGTTTYEGISYSGD
jgi:plastocyanin